MDNTNSPPLSPGAGQVAAMTREQLSKLPAERRLAEIARIRRNILVRRVELEAEHRGAILTFAELRRESAKLMEQRLRPIGLRARHPKALAWRRAEIEMQLELLVQGLEDRIAQLPTLDDVRLCYVEGLDPAPPDRRHYVEASQPVAEQLLRAQKRLLAAFSAARQEAVINRLARAHMRRRGELSDPTKFEIVGIGAGPAIKRLLELAHAEPGSDPEALKEVQAVLYRMGGGGEAIGYVAEKLAATKEAFETWLGVGTQEQYGSDPQMFRTILLQDIEKLRKAIARGAAGQD